MIIKRGILDNFFTTVHTDFFMIQYIAQIGNPFIQFVLQFIFWRWTMANI